MSVTTIRVESKVKGVLDSLKIFERESYQDVIKRLSNIAKEEDVLSAHEIKQIENSLDDLKKGKFLGLKEAEKKWGI
ncbi:MAG: hypothetical protein Q7K42_06190 [Candidatus Diapherotrites archaeon]|nr:hypothetical protein [Candidatus Diapherotrites archaeon]